MGADVTGGPREEIRLYLQEGQEREQRPGLGAAVPRGPAVREHFGLFGGSKNPLIFDSYTSGRSLNFTPIILFYPKYFFSAD